MKRTYVAPLVTGKAALELEAGILTGSVVENRMDVETAGHEKVDHDFTDLGFNHSWK